MVFHVVITNGTPWEFSAKGGNDNVTYIFNDIVQQGEWLGLAGKWMVGGVATWLPCQGDVLLTA